MPFNPSLIGIYRQSNLITPRARASIGIFSFLLTTKVFLSRFLSMSCRILFSVCLLASASFPAPGATWNPAPSLGNVEQHRHLYDIARNFGDAGFDPGANLIGEVSTKHPEPSKTRHIIRESAYYAYGLLLTGNPADRARAQAILRNVLAAQDTRPGSPSLGAFLWIAEDKWEALPNPDLNSAAFVGTALACIIDLDRGTPSLGPDLRRQVETACRLAVEDVISRNVDTNYTNIALLSTGLAAAGAKLWNMPDAAAFAQSKLDTVYALAADGVCYEYLCPTYTAVDLSGAYLARKFAFSPAFAEKSDAMIDSLWRQVAASYHAPTFQMGGPFGRAYGDDMLRYSAGLKYWLYLALDGAYPIAKVEKRHDGDQGGLALLAILPVSPRPEFKAPVPAWREFTAIGGGQWPERHLCQYREGNFILGTVAFQDEWPQKRNLVAYWRNDGPPPDGLRVGFCIDESNESLPSGFPYGQLHFYSQQVKGAALVAIVGSRQIPPQGGCSLVFNPEATGTPGDGAAPFRVQDGAMTTYLYPVSTAAASFEAQADAPHHIMRVIRPWSSADSVGDLHVLSYLVVFRPSDQPAPAVSGLALKADAIGVSASANVDGDNLSLLFKN